MEEPFAKFMCRFLVILGFTATVLAQAPPPPPPAPPKGPPHLTAQERTKLFAPDYQVVWSVKKLPKTCMTGFGLAVGEIGPLIADPDQKFQAGDVITASLPRRRLIFGGYAAGRCFIYYERGGRAHTFNIVVIADSMKMLWSAYIDGRAKDLDGLRKGLLGARDVQVNI